MSYEPRLYKKYKEEIVPQMMEKFNYDSIMGVPKITKISINQGIGRAIQDKKIIEKSVEELSIIAGQKAVSTKARKSIANFHLRDGMIVGTKVTLRRKQMYEFMDRLLTVSLARVRDFRGVNDKSFDGRGNYALGIEEQIIFPEIKVDQVDNIRGMDITFVTTAETDAEAYELLKLFGMPFKNIHNN